MIMRSLTTKLILAFLIVSLTGAAISAVYLQRRTRSEFTRFLSDQYQSNMVNALLNYYRENGSWSGVATLMRQLDGSSRRSEFNPAPDGEAPPSEIRRVPLTLVDRKRVVIYEGLLPRPQRLATEAEIAQGMALEVDGVVVGWLTINERALARLSGAPELRFLATINRVILVSALAAMLIGLLLGAALAQGLTRPIRELTEATQELAKGNLGAQVAIRSKDEMGRLAESFNQMSADLASANQSRRQMTADIAHDLRSPLSVILGYTEALSDEKLKGSPEVFDVMYKEAGHLNHLIEDLRTLSLADAGDLPLYQQPLSPGVIMERAAAAYRPLCEQKQIQLTLDNQPGLPTLHLDAERMAQVLGNLLTNALRYTPAGGNIALAARGAAGSVELHVQDSGPGIPLDEQANVFHRFYRGDPTRPHNGETGLGLAIAKSLVEAQGGSIRLESEPGKGAHFILEFPL